jgi:4-amino-4-deoxy-L-arabinose transferase-like glycosyltransferase
MQSIAPLSAQLDSSRPVPPAAPLTADPAIVPAGWTAAASRLLAVLVLLVILEALFSVPKLTWELAGVGIPSTVVGLALAAAGVAAVWTARYRLAALVQRAGERLAAIPRRRWLAALILGGIALRIAWVLAFPAPFTSDGRAYYDLAVRLAAGQTYQTPQGEWAIWPPGYPFLLLVLFKTLGIGSLAVTVANLLLFVATVWLVDLLARRFSEGVARLATLLVACWPNLVSSAGVASKDMVIVPLLPAVLLLYLLAGERRSPGRAAASLAAGLALGYAVLTQPGLLLLAAVFLLYEVLLRSPVRSAAPRLALLALGMGLVILPWTWRNQRVLGTPVLVATTGGNVFYRANNPLATGGWIRDGERSLRGYDELTRDRLGYQWGKEWIRDHPGDFLRLSVRKQILFLGDDATGLYEIKRSGRIGGLVYALSKLATNAWWWGLCALVLTAFLLRWSTLWHRRAEIVLFLLTILYFWAIDSVFESGARHHLPLAGVLAILAASVRVVQPADQRHP